LHITEHDFVPVGVDPSHVFPATAPSVHMHAPLLHWMPV
jgi:hypothetical protein